MQRPNILILYTDQQRWDALGANGNAEILTPNLDRLAAEGANLDRYFVQNPVCMPSRVSFLTSQYCSQLGILTNGVRVPEDTPTLATYLSNYGYTCGNIGKLHFLPHANRDHMDPHPRYGFDALVNSDEPGCYEDAYRAWARAQAPEEMDRISLGLPPAREPWEQMMGREPIEHPVRELKCAIPFTGADHLSHSAFVADETMRFIGENQQRPFLAIAGFYSPHSPWIVPQKYLDMYDPRALSLPRIPDGWQAPHGRAAIGEAELRSVRQGYYAMITEVDDYVGQILHHLEDRGLTDNTIVLFVSDHGEYLGDYHTYGKGPPGQDCISRVPCVLRWPGQIPAGRTVHELTEAVDVLPTLLQAAAIPVPKAVQGQSFLAALRGQAHTPRTSALTESRNCRALRTDNHRYVAHMDGREELFDLLQDPGEYIDVSHDDDYATTLSEHRQMMIQRLMATDLHLRREWAY